MKHGRSKTAERVRRARLAAGLTQERLAELSGLSQQQIQRCEAGRTNLSVKSAQRLGKALDVSAAHLLCTEPEGGNAPAPARFTVEQIKIMKLYRAITKKKSRRLLMHTARELIGI